MDYLFTIDKQDKSIKFVAGDVTIWNMHPDNINDIADWINWFDFTHDVRTFDTTLAYGYVVDKHGNRIHLADKTLNQIEKSKMQRQQNLLRKSIKEHNVHLDELVNNLAKFKQGYICSNA